MSVSRRSRVLASATLAATVVGLGATTVQAAGAAPAPSSAAWVHLTKATPASGILQRTAIPWKSVGTGWAAVNVTRAGANRLALVSPGGQPYEIGVLSSNESVTQIANDGRHVLTQAYTNRGLITRIWDVASGKAVALPTNVQNATFTRPSGSAVMAYDGSNTYLRYSTSGQLLMRKAEPGRSHSNLYRLLPNPNGVTDAVSVSQQSLGHVELYSHAGYVRQRSFALPAGAEWCGATAWQNSTTLLEVCSMKADRNGQRLEVFAQNIAGGAPRALTSGTYPGGSAWGGWVDVAHTSIGDIGVGQENTAGWMGARGGYVLKGTRATTFVGAPKVNANGGPYAGGYVAQIVGDTMVYASAPVGDSSSTKPMLAEYDVRTKKLVYLAGNNSRYTGALGSFAVIDPRA